MKLSKYQEFTRTCPIYDDPVLGLPGEVGEVLEHIKKDRRPSESGFRKPLNKEELTNELGDVLFYLTQLADDNGISMAQVAVRNRRKLQKRHKL